MRECDNSKIHISSNFLLSICLLIMLDTLLLVPSLHCNTSQHFTTLHFTTLIDTSLPFIYTSLPSHLAQPIYISYCSIFPPITKLDTVRLSRPRTYFQNNEPLPYPKEPFTISLNFLFIFSFFFSLMLSTLHFTLLCCSPLQLASLHFTLLCCSPLQLAFLHFTLLCYSPLQLASLHFTSLHFLLFIAFTSRTVLHFPNPRFENTNFTVGSPCSPFR